jgi:hypothetical protein
MYKALPLSVLITLVAACTSKEPHGESYKDELQREREWQTQALAALRAGDYAQFARLHRDRCGVSVVEIGQAYASKCVEFAVRVECRGLVLDPELHAPADCMRLRE